MKIKYCGNCNPDVHPRYVREALIRAFAESGDRDVVVAVNGCSRICISKGKVKDVPENAIIVGAGDVVKRRAPNKRDGKKTP
jgi:hypothetical protein